MPFFMASIAPTCRWGVSAVLPLCGWFDNVAMLILGHGPQRHTQLPPLSTAHYRDLEEDLLTHTTHVQTNPTTAAASYPAGVRWQNSIRLENFDWPRQMIEVAFRHTRRMAETWIEFLNWFWASMRKKPNHFTPMPFFLFFLMCSTVAMSIWASTPHIRTVKYYIEFSEL